MINNPKQAFVRKSIFYSDYRFFRTPKLLALASRQISQSKWNLVCQVPMHSSLILYQIMGRGPFIRFIPASEHWWRPNTDGLLYITLSVVWAAGQLTGLLQKAALGSLIVPYSTGLMPSVVRQVWSSLASQTAFLLFLFVMVFYGSGARD